MNIQLFAADNAPVGQFKVADVSMDGPWPSVALIGNRAFLIKRFGPGNVPIYREVAVLIVHEEMRGAP